MTITPDASSTTYLVTGTTGGLGEAAVRALVERGVPAERVVAAARDTSRLEGPGGLAELGVTVRALDYTDPASISAALKGVDRVLLVSSNALGQRTTQHRAVIEAAAAAGVDLLAYTSIANAGTTTMLLAGEHQETERLIVESGLPHTFLRNSWYFENHTGQLAVQLEHGALLGATGGASYNPAARADYGDAAAAALLLDSPAEAYELGGAPLTLEQLAAVVTEVTGTTVAYVDVPEAELEKVLLGAGLPAPLAHTLAEADSGLGRGELQVDPAVLEGLIGRAATSAEDAVRAAFAALPQA